jgi:hypothetical protein
MPAGPLVMVIDRDLGSGPDEQIQATHETLTLSEIARCDHAALCAPSGCKGPASGSLTNGVLRDRNWWAKRVRPIDTPVALRLSHSTPGNG